MTAQVNAQPMRMLAREAGMPDGACIDSSEDYGEEAQLSSFEAGHCQSTQDSLARTACAHCIEGVCDELQLAAALTGIEAATGAQAAREQQVRVDAPRWLLAQMVDGEQADNENHTASFIEKGLLIASGNAADKRTTFAAALQALTPFERLTLAAYAGGEPYGRLIDPAAILKLTASTPRYLERRLLPKCQALLSSADGIKPIASDHLRRDLELLVNHDLQSEQNHSREIVVPLQDLLPAADTLSIGERVVLGQALLSHFNSPLFQSREETSDKSFADLLTQLQQAYKLHCRLTAKKLSGNHGVGMFFALLGNGSRGQEPQPFAEVWPRVAAKYPALHEQYRIRQAFLKELRTFSGWYKKAIPQASQPLPEVITANNWELAANCQSVPEEKFEHIFGLNNSDGVARASKYCQPCPVREHCLEDALQRDDPNQPYFIRGGVTARQRKAMLLQRNPALAQRREDP